LFGINVISEFYVFLHLSAGVMNDVL